MPRSYVQSSNWWLRQFIMGFGLLQYWWVLFMKKHDLCFKISILVVLVLISWLIFPFVTPHFRSSPSPWNLLLRALVLFYVTRHPLLRRGAQFSLGENKKWRRSTTRSKLVLALGTGRSYSAVVTSSVTHFTLLSPRECVWSVCTKSQLIVNILSATMNRWKKREKTVEKKV